MKNNYQCNFNGVRMGGGSIEHPFSIHSASIGTRWKPRGMQVLMTLVFLFTLGIGQMWGTTAKQGTYYLFYGTSVNTAGNNLNTSDFIFAKDYVVNTSVSPAKTIGDGSFTHYVTPKSYGATSVASADPEKIMIYNAKTSVTKLTLYIKNDRNGAKDYYIDHVFEGEKTATADRAYKKSFTKASENGGTDDCEKKEYTFTNTNKKNVSIYVMPGQDVRIYQAIVEETGDDLLDIGEDGYVLGGYRSGVKTTGAITFEGLEILSTSNKAVLSGNIGVFTVSSSKPSGYMRFTTPNNGKYVLLTATHSSTKALQIEERASLPANTSGYSQLATAVTETKKKLSPNTTYMMFSINSGITMNTLTFSIPKVTYNANGGSETMAATEWTVAANGFTAPSGKKFDKWNTQADGEGDDVTVGTEVDANTNLFAIWKDDVAEYTVTYKDGETTLKSVNVAVGSAPDAYSPTKDFYTFAAWQKDAADFDPATLASTATSGQTITLNARWTAQYTSGTYEFTGHLTMGTDPQMTIANSSDGSNYEAGRIDNIYVSAQKIGYQNDGGDYDGWKLKTTNGTLRFMVENTCGIRVTIGEANPLRIAYTEGEVAKSADIAKSTTSSVYKADANSLVTLTNFTASNKTVTLKKIEILPLYNATYTDGTGDASGSASNVAEVTLPTPTETTVGGSTFTGWTANKTVYDGVTEKTSGAALDAGKKYTLTDNTTFTAQWATISDFDVKFYQGYGDPDVQIGETQSISTGNYATAPVTDPTREGYNFKGWSYDATEAHIVDVATYGITAATNFTAIWKQVFTVTFDGAGEVSVESGSKVASPDSPSQAGKVFLGWYNGESKYDFLAAVTEDLTLESKWTTADANHYYYNYKDDFHFDGVVYKTPEGKVDEGAGASNIAITTPYTLFSGAEGITSIVATKAIYDSKSNWVNAYLKINTSEDSYLTFTIKSGYTAVLKMKMGGYSANPTVTLKKGEDVVDAASGTIGGVASTENNYNEITYNLLAGTYTMTTATKTLYISHIDLEATALPAYTVNYLPGEATGAEYIIDNDATEVRECPVEFIAPTGKIFNGWKDGDGNDVAVGAIVESNMALTAQWINHYAVTFNMNGHGSAIDAQDVKHGAKATRPDDPEAIGWEFGGWFTDNGTFEAPFDFENTTITAATPLYAKWTAFGGCTELWPATSGSDLSVGATVDLQSGSNGGTIKVAGMKYTSGDNISVKYTSAGLALTGGGADSIRVELNNLIAKDTKITLVMVAGSTGERGLNILTLGKSKVYEAKWTASENGELKTIEYVVPESSPLIGKNAFLLQRNNTVYLKAIKVSSCGAALLNLSSAITVAGKGTVTLSATKVASGATATATYSDIDAAYEFDEWEITSGDATIADASVNPATITMGTTDAVVTLKLKTAAPKHTVTFNKMGKGDDIAPALVAEGALVPEPSVTEPEGWMLEGWYKEMGLENKWDFASDVMSTSNIELFANWIADTSIKLFDGEGNLNTTNFVSAAASTIEIDAVEYPTLVAFGSNRSSLAGAKQADLVKYDATTDAAKMKITFYNTNASSKTAYLWKVEEGDTEATPIEIDVPGQEIYTTDYYTFNSTKNRSFYVTSGAKSEIKILQVRVIESGTDIHQFGQAGYVVNFNKGRAVGASDATVKLDGASITMKSEYSVLNSTSLSPKTYIQFENAVANTIVRITKASSNKYYVTNDLDNKGDEYSTDKEITLTTTGTWYIGSVSSGSAAAFSSIEFIAPKCEEPSVTDMDDVDLCEGDAFAPLTVSASVSGGGTLHYAWYKEAGATDVAVGTDAASYTPEADGEYYVVVTNKKDGFSDNSATSNTITVTHYAAAVITTAPLNQRGTVGAEVTLSVAATGKNVSYKWYTCDEDGNNEEALDPAQTGNSISVTIPAGTQWYKVKVTSDCGNAEAKAKVSEFEATTPANVTTSMLWDWTSSAWPASGEIQFTDKIIDGTDFSKEYELLADADAAVPNNDGFRSDMLYGKGQYVWRSGNKFFQGTAIKFTSDVAGLVRVYFRSTGNNKHVQVEVKNGANTTLAGTYEKDDFRWSEFVEVAAGDVEILCTATDASKAMTRIQQLEFVVPGCEDREVSGSTNVSALESGANVTVHDGGTLVIDVAKTINDLIVEEGGKVQLAANKLTVVGAFSIETTMAGGNSGQLTGATASNFAATEAYIDITLGAEGKRNAQWHAFTVPFPVDAMNGVYDASTGEKLTNEVNYAIMDYHGDVRATGAYGWKKYRGTLVPGTFYLMTVDGERATYRFKKTAVGAIVAANSKSYSEYAASGAGQSTDAGWNGIGNPTLKYGQVNAVVQVLDPESYTYVTKGANSTNFVVGTPFFYQAADNGSIVMADADAEDAYYAPRRAEANEVGRIKVSFGNEAFTDYLNISASEEALNEYQIGKDLVKMTMTKTPKVAQIFGKAYNAKLCMVYAPMVNNQAVYDLTLYAPNAGEYTMAAPAMENADIFLTKDGAIIWNLSMSACTLDLNKGNNEGYGLILQAKAPNATTGCENIDASEAAQKVIIDNNVYILRNKQMYDVTGKAVK